MWILLTLIATALQTARNTLSKVLAADLDRETVTLARFLYALPVVSVITLWGWERFGPTTISEPQFFLWAALFAVMQLTANSIMLELFHHKNYAISITFIRSESFFIAILGWLFIGENLSLLGIIGMGLALIGVQIASLAKGKNTLTRFLKSLTQRSALLGLATGFCFGVGAIAIKYAFTFLSAPVAWQVPLFALLAALVVQSLILLPLQLVRRPRDIHTLLAKPVKPLILGTLSGLGSFFWFIAFSLTLLAYVKTVGQLEVGFSILVALSFFKEKIRRLEWIGMGLILLGSSLLFWA